MPRRQKRILTTLKVLSGRGTPRSGPGPVPSSGRDLRRPAGGWDRHAPGAHGGGGQADQPHDGRGGAGEEQSRRGRKGNHFEFGGSKCATSEWHPALGQQVQRV